jgi:copper resistance protein B
MKPLRSALLSAAGSMFAVSPLAAQHAGHGAPSAAKTAASCTAEHAAMGHCTLPPAAPQDEEPGERHAGHDASKAPAADPHAGHETPTTQTADPHAGHATPGSPAADPHAGHQMPETGDAADGHKGETAGTNLAPGNEPAPPVPTANAADAIYGREAMQMGRHHLNEHHGGQKFFQVMANLAEYQLREGRDTYEWDAEAWYGGDMNRLWLKSEGEGAFGRSIETAELQALYSRALDPYWNLQGGIRYDFRPNPSRVYATIGVEGLAPSFFDVEGAVFLSNKGELMARAEGSYDQRITQRLILQPRIELNLAAQSSPKLGVGSGLTDAEIGVRLRYDIRREFAPYVGVQYQRAFGNTRKLLRAEGEDVGGWTVVMGVRTWF